MSLSPRFGGIRPKELFVDFVDKAMSDPIDPCTVLVIELSEMDELRDRGDDARADRLLALATSRIEQRFQKSKVTELGDRIAVILPREQGAQPSELSASIGELVGRTYLVDGAVFTTHVRVGSTISTKGADAGDVWQQACLALSHARREGLDAFAFTPEVAAQDADQRALEIDLQRALMLDQLHLAYQPQLDLRTMRLSGFEALLRWTHPVRGAITPSVFIPLAERSGAIIAIGRWVLEQACRTAADWPAHLSIGVNVSAVQFRHPALVEDVKHALSKSRLSPDRLDLEVTESLMVHDAQKTRAMLRELKDCGVAISLDDFGTGYSSLSYLRSLPFDRIKIDQSFIRGGADTDQRTIVKAAVLLGKGLGMRTLAEGVETLEQLARIVEDGCDTAQGYFVSRPMPEADVLPFIARWSGGLNRGTIHGR